MEENSVNEISLLDLVKVFKKKFKAIVVIALVLAIVGGGVGGLLAILNRTYSVEMEIFVTPADGSDRLMYNLRSARFAEQLLLEENGLPAKELCNAADYEAAEKVLNELAEIRQKRIDKSEEISRYYTSDIEHRYTVLTNEYNRILNVLQMYKNAQTDALVNEAHAATMAEYEEKLREAEQAREDYYNEYYSKVEDKRIQLNTELAELNDQLKDKRDEVDDAVEKVLATWRTNPEVASFVNTIVNCVKYEYHALNYFEEEETKEEDEEASRTLHRGYIKIKIEVPASDIPETAADGKTYVEEIVTRFNNRVDEYVEDYLERNVGSYEAKCTVISPIVQIKDNSSLIVDGIKFAVIGGVAGGVLAYLYFVVQMLMQEGEKTEEQKKRAVAEGKTDSSSK